MSDLTGWTPFVDTGRFRFGDPPDPRRPLAAIPTGELLARGRRLADSLAADLADGAFEGAERARVARLVKRLANV